MINYLAEKNYGVMLVIVPMAFVGTIVMVSLNHVFKFFLFAYLVCKSATTTDAVIEIVPAASQNVDQFILVAHYLRFFVLR